MLDWVRRLIGYQRVEMVVARPPLEVVAKIRAATKPAFSISWSSSDQRRLKGSVWVLAFQVERRSWYGNAFRPVLDGAVATGQEGGTSFVSVRVRLNLFASAFMALWFSVLGLAALAIFCAVVARGEPPATLLAPLAMGGMGGAMVVGGYRMERAATVGALRAVLGPRETHVTGV